MEGHNRFMVATIVAITLGICLFTGIILYGFTDRYVKMAERGYEQKMVIGRSSPVWQKSE
jgi:hypothetical protein